MRLSKDFVFAVRTVTLVIGRFGEFTLSAVEVLSVRVKWHSSSRGLFNDVVFDLHTNDIEQAKNLVTVILRPDVFCRDEESRISKHGFFTPLRGACAEHFGCAQYKLAEAFRMTIPTFVRSCH
jgi:hypothetical protein